MLFVFQVETGKMMVFEMALAVACVADLKRSIQEQHKINILDQVLLVSGGVTLDDNSRVCTYSSGVETNPIFLFDRTTIQNVATKNNGIPPEQKFYSCKTDFRTKVNKAQELPASYETLVSRVELAKEFLDAALVLSKDCEDLVHEQHLQQQGWAAVIANLEDLMVDFHKKVDLSLKNFKDYLQDRDRYCNLLEHFNDDLEILEKIPIVPILLENEAIIIEKAEESSKEENSQSTDDEAVEKKSDDNNKREPTLLDWISSTDTKSTMKQMYNHCSEGLKLFDEEYFNKIDTDIANIIEASNQTKLKEIKGLADRLFSLDQMLDEAQKLVKDQKYVVQGFIQNQTRAGNLGDTSVLPDLCESHKTQLGVLVANHHKLKDVHKRCVKAKIELSFNLYSRLTFVIYVESTIQDMNHCFLYTHDNLRRLRQHFEVIQQIHVTPTIYLGAITEVIRRRTFSEAFLIWASELACYLLTIYNEELTRRKEFQAKFDGHFLSVLFPGMDDLPPPFATEAPSIFDTSLPKISVEDIEELKKALPDFAESLNITDMTAITNFFLSKSIVKNEDDKEEENCAIEEKLVQVVNEVGLASNLDQKLLKATDSETCLVAHGLAHLKDLDKGFESETDTEEFEKVCQSPMDLQFEKDLPSPCVAAVQETTATEEVGDMKSSSSLIIPPKKPPRSFQKLTASGGEMQIQRTLSISGSNTESFTNIKNPSLESIDELSSLKNIDSCYNSHHHLQSVPSMHSMSLRSKSLSPHTPQSPKCDQNLSPNSPSQGHQPSEFVNEEFYIDESLPSSLSIDVAAGHQVQSDYAKQLSNANDVVALLQTNLQTSRGEQDKLKELVVHIGTLSKEALSNVRKQMNEMKSILSTQKSAMDSCHQDIGSTWETLSSEYNGKERELVERLTRDHNAKVDEYKKIQYSNNEEIKCLREENSCLDSSLNKLSRQNRDLMDSLASVREEMAGLKSKHESEKERCIKDTEDRLVRAHKLEMDNLRNKFRLMTEKDRSPSDPSLEKIPDSADVSRQIKESQRFEKLLAERLKTSTRDKTEGLSEAAHNKLVEKELLIETLLEREANLKLECLKCKNINEQLTDSHRELEEKLKSLERERGELQTQLSDMSSSFISLGTNKTDASTSPLKKEKTSKSSHSGSLSSDSRKLNIDSCNINDNVLVLWTPSYNHYSVLQHEGRYMHFINHDCLEEFNIKKPSADCRDLVFFPGTVTYKEFCQTRKAENRFNVPRGTQFFRVKVKPLSSPQEGVKSAPQKQQMSQSQMTADPVPIMDESVSDATCHSLPSSPTKDESGSNR